MDMPWSLSVHGDSLLQQGLEVDATLSHKFVFANPMRRPADNRRFFGATDGSSGARVGAGEASAGLSGAVSTSCAKVTLTRLGDQNDDREYDRQNKSG